MHSSPFFSASSRVWDSNEWILGIEEIGYAGWEIVADGRYSFEHPAQFKDLQEMLGTTDLRVTVHAPYSDLNLASMNFPIWRESVRQICSCIAHASTLAADRVTLHPGYLSPVGKLVPDKVWEAQKTALREIGTCAVDHGILACLENMGGVREFLCRFPEEIIGMTEGIEGIGITIDIGHANTVGKVDDFLRTMGHAHHLHIHDNHGAHDEHLALGDGNINWQKVGSAASSYTGIAVIEGRNLEEARRSLQVFRRCFV
jgi:sugar phosphate isomerase/epimerase